MFVAPAPSLEKWLARYCPGGLISLADTLLLQLQHALELRHQLCTLRRIIRFLGALLSTVGRVMKSLCHGRMPILELIAPLRLSHWENPGYMFHICN